MEVHQFRAMKKHIAAKWEDLYLAWEWLNGRTPFSLEEL
jgi:hypothetical protein